MASAGSAQPSPTPRGRSSQSVTVSDVNGDGNVDLVVADQTGGIYVLPGDGIGGFGAATTYDTGLSRLFPSSVTTADMNGDGKLDLVAAGSGGVSVLLEMASARSTRPSPTLRRTPRSVTVSDLNGDSKLDLVVADLFGSVAGTMAAFICCWGMASAGSAQRPATPQARLPNAVTTVDLNGDGKLDLIAADNGFGTVSVLLEVDARWVSTARA